MMKKIFIIISIAVVSIVKAQVGINTTTPNLSSMLDIVSSDKGVLFPQYELVSLTNNTSPVNNPVKGSIIYNKGTGISNYPKGYFYWTGSAWERMLMNNEVDQILRVQVFGGTSGQPIIIPSGTGNNIVSFNSTGIINTIPGVTFSGGQNITLPAGTYRVDVTLDCYNDSTSVAAFITNYSFFVVNAGIVNTSNTLLTDLKTGTQISGSGYAPGKIQGYKFTYILQLPVSQSVRLMLNHGNGFSEGGNTYANQSGLVATFYKMYE